MIKDIFFDSSSEILNKAYRIAVGDIVGNIALYHNGLMKESAPCLYAGIDYDTPWTRDTAINVWNALAILSPEVSRNTLLAVCCHERGRDIIGTGYDQYWDCIIWAIGAYHYCEVTGDKDFLKKVYEITLNTLEKYEKEEFDPEKNLFRGPAVYGDGTAAYPDKYGVLKDCSSRVLDWVTTYPDKIVKTGYGIPMFALSTNCIYYMVYQICATIANKFGYGDEKHTAEEFEKKAYNLKEAINREFWNEQRQSYDYLAGECSYQEGLGLALAVLSGIAQKDKAIRVIENAVISEHGIPCVWPSFERYLKQGNMGRHSGTVWPFIQGFWGQVLYQYGYMHEFDRNLFQMAEKACRDGFFSEIYHSKTGEIYGGLQENIDFGEIVMWDATRRQSWSASAFLSLIYNCVLGLKYVDEGMEIHPYLPQNCDYVKLTGIPLMGKKVDVTVKRGSDAPNDILVFADGKDEKIVLSV